MIFLIAGALAFTAACNFLESGFVAVEEQKREALGEALEKAAPGAWLVVYQGRVHAVVKDGLNAAIALEGIKEGCPLRDDERGSLPPGIPEDVAIQHYRKVGRYVAG